jgi:hypothetical protein
VVLISSSPRILGRCLSSLVLCAGFIAIPGFAQPIFLMMEESTPYDRQMTRVLPVIAAPSYAEADQVSLQMVNLWMIKLRKIRYRYSREWKTPAEVKLERAADCKGKALALYEMMQVNGAKNVRLIIGKRRVDDLLTHAWLEWEAGNGNYLLDPTFNWLAVKTPQRSPKRYIPLYVYEGAFKYRVASIPLFRVTEEAAPVRVASGRRYVSGGQ